MRFEALDSWRGLCALWVVLYHFRAVSHLYDWGWVRAGDIAVDFFFVLSGFVISHAYGERLAEAGDRVRFLIRRFGRLYPLHLATLAAVLALEIGRWGAGQALGQPIGRPPFSGDTDPLALPANLLLVHAWGLFREFTWNIPSWSISVEWALCLLYAGLSALRRPLLVAGLLAGAGLAIGIWFASLPAYPFEGHSAVTRGVFGFFLGVLVYRLFLVLRERGLSPPGWLEWAAPGLLVLAVLFKDWQADWACTVAFAGLVLLFAFEAGPVSRLMRRRPMLFLGEISYSIYLVHYVLLLVAFGAAAALGGLLDFTPIVERGPFNAQVINMPSAWVGDLAVVVFVLAVIGIAALTYRFVEDPGRRFFNRLAARPSQNAPPPAAA